jgi:hypothetical protein
VCLGIALAWSELPLAFIEAHSLTARVHERGGEREVRFLWREADRLLPVWHQGQLRLVRWGSRRADSRRLPTTGWTWQETVEASKWGPFGVEPVDIPATSALDGGVWYGVYQGIRGLLVNDERGEPAAYMICTQASRYYRVMTGSDRMPVLIGQTI